MEALMPDESYNGTWEREGRSLNAAALAGLLGVGIIYFYGGGLMASLSVFLARRGASFDGEAEGFFDHLIRMEELTKNPIRVCVTLSQFLLMLGPTLWLIRRWHTLNVRAYIRLKPCSPVQIALAFCTVVFLFPANHDLSGFFVDKLNIPEELLRVNEVLVRSSGLWEFFFVIFVIAVTPAICEEVLFRGYAQRTFERTMGWKSVVLVGFLFGLYHMQPLGLISLSGLGWVFGYFYYASRSLLPGMVAHFTNNFAAVLMVHIAERQRLAGNPSTLHIPPALTVAGLLLAAAAIYGFYRVSASSSHDPLPAEGQAGNTSGVP